MDGDTWHEECDMTVVIVIVIVVVVIVVVVGGGGGAKDVIKNKRFLQLYCTVQ